MQNKFVFFLPTFPDVMYSFLLTLAKKHRSDVTIVCFDNILPERKNMFEQSELSEKAKLIYYTKESEFGSFIKKIISENEQAVFVFGGLLGNVGKALSVYNDVGGKKAIVITEKPSIRPVKHFNCIVKILKLIKTRLVYSRALIL